MSRMADKMQQALKRMDQRKKYNAQKVRAAEQGFLRPKRKPGATHGR